MLAFDAATHTYTWQGEVVPHVTGIISHLTSYDRIPPESLERARQQGVAVHKMVELDCKGTLADLPEWMFGHFDAWCRFKAESGFECWASERYLFHSRLGYAGTVDLVGLLPKLRTSKKPAVLDVKRSFYAGPAIGLQTAGYLEAANTAPGMDRIEERYALKLDANGTYRLQRYEDRDDSIAFLACLQQLRWKEKHYGNR